MSILPVLSRLPLPALVGIAGLVLLLVVGLVVGWRMYRRRRERAAQLRALTECAYEYLRNVLIPDPQGAPLHFDFLLLTSRGIVVVDLREVAGNIFGGDQMKEWAVINGAVRFTFPNPQAALYDREATVRLVARETPVEGRIVFGRRSLFPKGLPSHTRLIAVLAADFPLSDRELSALPEAWVSDWRSLQAACTPSTVVGKRAAL
jgi:hypothetical protein